MKKQKKSLFIIIIIVVIAIVGGISAGKSENGSNTETETYATVKVENTTEYLETTSNEQKSTIEETTVSETTTAEIESTETTTSAMENTADSLPADSTFSITYIDVGQGDAALVECDGHYMLVDGGNKNCSSQMYSILKTKGINHLDIVVASHPDADHVGGLSGALNYATADLVLCSATAHDTEAFEDFAKYAALNGNGIQVPSAGDSYELGNADILILAVNTIPDDQNNSSIVLKITYGDTTFLFTGDLEHDGELVLLDSEYASELDSTVLKVAHHGSYKSTSYVFLREVMPEYAVISVGENNSYGHPHEELLSRLRDEGAAVFRTDLQGDIVCTSDGSTVSFSVEKNADADTLETQTTVTTTVQTVDEGVPAAADASGTNTYILNKNTKKFHYPTCSSINQMAEHNKLEYTGTRDEVIKMGYEPCQRCNP